MTHWTDELPDACDEAVEWAKQYDDPNEAWKRCRRGDWMRWLLDTAGVLPRSFSPPGDPMECCGGCEAENILKGPATIRRYWPEWPL